MTQPRTARAADLPCELYAHTRAPVPARTQGHHRHPVYLQNRVYGGIRDPELLWLCGLCHDSVHEVIGWLLGESREPSPMPGRNAVDEAERTVAWYRAAALADEELRMIWDLQGSPQQNAIVQQALAACDFPFDQLLPSLQREGKAGIAVQWADLSRYTQGAAAHEHAEGAHAIIREVDGRARVLGLFYLPPNTRVVLDNALVDRPIVAQEVFLAEGAHAVDYHYMLDRGLRREVWNALHRDDQDVTADVAESGDAGHGHSWFDGPAGYGTWVGESFMAAFVEAFAPSIPVTISLDHPVTDEAARVIRQALVPAVAPVDPLAAFPYAELDQWAARSR